ncbi:MAG TPA: hypothetical protein VHC18_07945 [Amycolatopsis sp.]|nr:hypothetical protein [Amycolatopsis sp.]
MTSQLLTATTAGSINVPAALTVAALALLGWRLLLVWWFPNAPCGSCKGTGKHRRGKYWRPCRRCDGTGRKTRLGRRVWNWTRSTH